MLWPTVTVPPGTSSPGPLQGRVSPGPPGFRRGAAGVGSAGCAAQDRFAGSAGATAARAAAGTDFAGSARVGSAGAAGLGPARGRLGRVREVRRSHRRQVRQGCWGRVRRGRRGCRGRVRRGRHYVASLVTALAKQIQISYLGVILDLYKYGRKWGANYSYAPYNFLVTFCILCKSKITFWRVQHGIDAARLCRLRNRLVAAIAVCDRAFFYSVRGWANDPRLRLPTARCLGRARARIAQGFGRAERRRRRRCR